MISKGFMTFFLVNLIVFCISCKSNQESLEKYINKKNINYDTTPDEFQFFEVGNVSLNTIIESQRIFVSGITGLADINISEGNYLINGIYYKNKSGRVSNGDSVSIQLKSSHEYSSSTSSFLTIGKMTSKFTVTTIDDNSPDDFMFKEKKEAYLGSEVTSEKIFVSGVSVPVISAIEGGRYSINGGEYMLSNSMVQSGDSISIRQLSSTSISSTTKSILTIGDKNTEFRVTTLSQPLWRLTNNNFSDASPKINQRRVVWVGASINSGTDYEVFIYDVDTRETKQITNNDQEDWNLDIYRNIITWTGRDGTKENDSEIYFYDITTDTLTQLTDNSYDDWGSQVHDDIIVWSSQKGSNLDFHEINLFSLKSNATKVLTEVGRRFETPKTHNKKVVWSELSGDYYHIFLYDDVTKSIVQLTSNRVDSKLPQISNDKIVWLSGSIEAQEISLYNVLDQSIAKLDVAGQKINFIKLNDGQVVWRSSVGREISLYFYDLEIEKFVRLIRSSVNFIGIPELDNGQVVWSEYDFEKNSSEIVLYDNNLDQIIQITNNSRRDENPAIDNGQVVWRDTQNYNIQWSPIDSEIFLYSPKQEN